MIIVIDFTSSVSELEKVGYIFILLFINSISSFDSKTDKEILQNDYQMQIAGVKNWVQKIKWRITGYFDILVYVVHHLYA